MTDKPMTAAETAPRFGATATASAAPVVAELPLRTCKECGGRFRAWRSDQVFCATAHKRAFESRARSRGRTAYELLYKWRVTRGSGAGKGLLSQIAAVVDGWVMEDREKGCGGLTRGVDSREGGAT